MSKAKTPTVDETATVDKPLPPGTVELDEPIIRGKQSIESVVIRKPSAGELRGVSLGQLLNLQVDPLITVLPRVTVPPLTEDEIRKMDPADLVACGTEVASFFIQKRGRSSLTA